MDVDKEPEKCSLLKEVHGDEQTNQDDNTNHGNLLKGICATFVFVLLECSSGICIQLIERRIPDFELNTIRYTMPLVAYWLFALVYMQRWPTIVKTEIVSTVGLSALHFMQSIFHFAAFAFLPVASVKCVSLTSQIITGVIVFRIFLAETLGIINISSALSCIIGIILIMQPEFIFLKESVNGLNFMKLNEGENGTYPTGLLKLYQLC